MLAALIEGEPADAFPQPLLQGGEPLAADLRKQGDGPRLGFLKVVAGIAGVPLDALGATRRPTPPPPRDDDHGRRGSGDASHGHHDVYRNPIPQRSTSPEG